MVQNIIAFHFYEFPETDAKTCQQLPEDVTLEQAMAFGEKNNRNIQKPEP